eukprot:2522783-Lingulodinium_polyedra.AAC.1
MESNGAQSSPNHVRRSPMKPMGPLESIGVHWSPFEPIGRHWTPLDSAGVRPAESIGVRGSPSEPIGAHRVGLYWVPL